MPDDQAQDRADEPASDAARQPLNDSWWTRARLRLLYGVLRLFGGGRR